MSGLTLVAPIPMLKDRTFFFADTTVNIDPANAAYKLVWRLAGAEAIGPILLGMKMPVHVLQRGIDVADIVNMAAIAVVDAQEKAAAK